MMTRTPFFVVILLLAASAPALAQPSLTEVAWQPPASVPEQRSGWIGGLGFGRGGLDMSCDGCPDTSVNDGLSLTARAGRMVTPRLAVVGELWHIRWDGRDNGELGDSTDHHIEQTTFTVGGQLWLTKRLWVHLGIGGGRHATDVSYRSSPPVMPTSAGSSMPPSGDRSAVGAATASVGFEFIRRTDFAIDVQLRSGATASDERGIAVDSSGVVLGLNWY